MVVRVGVVIGQVLKGRVKELCDGGLVRVADRVNRGAPFGDVDRFVGETFAVDEVRLHSHIDHEVAA